MRINKAFSFRFYPAKDQEKFLLNQFGASRFVFNHFLRQRIDFYATHKGEKKQSLNFFDTAKMLTTLKALPDTAWLNEANSQSLQSVLKHLDIAYNNFFNKRGEFPKFKSKRDKQSFIVPQHFAVTGGHIKMPKIGIVKIVNHRPIEGKPKSVTVSRTKTGKYFASVLCELKKTVKAKKVGGEIGVDLGLKTFAVTSEGQRIESPKYLRKAEAKLKRAQRAVSRKKKGGTNRAKAIKLLAIQHEKVANQRKDFLHKESSRLVCENQEICTENLNVKGMSANYRLAKSIADSGWSEFIRQLTYKSEWHGVRFNQLDRFFPSSKRCFECGWINNGLTLKDREWTCLECRTVLDRDLNAAKNIFHFAHQSSKGRAGHARTQRLGRVTGLADLGSPRL